MSKQSKIIQGRTKWKEKALKRGKSEGYLKRENDRLRFERNQYKEKNNKILLELKELRSKKTYCVNDKEDLVYLTLQLFLVANIGFRAVSRVLGVLAPLLGILKVPCPQTVINWVTRLSIVRMKNISNLGRNHIPSDPFSNGFIWMIDTSIGLGAGKILALLRIRANFHNGEKKAPTLKDADCVAVGVASSWTGENIKNFLVKVIDVLGRPIAFLKDGGKDLEKAVGLLCKQGINCFKIDDLSHKIANLLKHEYKDHSQFETFLSVCGNISKKLKQSVLACLAPPKVSIKSRFMNLHRLVNWANKILKHSGKGKASEGSLLEKLRTDLEGLPECKNFINLFLRDATALLKCQEILKNRGLSKTSFEECKGIILTIPPSSSIHKGFIQWGEEHLEIAKNLGVENEGLSISTDLLESLFGKGKRHGTGDIVDANRIAIRLPAYCGQLTKDEASKVVAITVKEQAKLLENHESLAKQRIKVLPRPGTLETLSSKKSAVTFELIPSPQKRARKEQEEYLEVESINYCGTSFGPFNFNIPSRKTRDKGFAACAL